MVSRTIQPSTPTHSPFIHTTRTTSRASYKRLRRAVRMTCHTCSSMVFSRNRRAPAPTEWVSITVSISWRSPKSRNSRWASSERVAKAQRLTCGSFCWSSCRIVSTAHVSSSGRVVIKASLNSSTQRLSQSYGACTKTSLTWTTKRWDVHFATTISEAFLRRSTVSVWCISS